MTSGPDAEIGNRDGLKHRCSLELEGSTPSLGTIFNPYDKQIRRIYGPYLRTYKRSQSRRQVVVEFEDGSVTSMSNARWVMTQYLRRRLDSTEHVDHIDENALNDEISNLQLLTLAANNMKSNIGRPSPFLGVERGWRHGTMYGWMKKKCVCSCCSKAKRAWYDDRNAKRRS